MAIPRIVMTPGDPAGIGPDVTLQAAQTPLPCELIVIADPALLEKRAGELGIKINLSNVDFNTPPQMHEPSLLKVMPVPLSEPAEAGKLNSANASYVLETLKCATKLALSKKVSAIVTGPVQKSMLQEAGFAFMGHTEFFAQQCGVNLTVMMFVVKNLKVALATTHLPLKKVPDAVTHDHLKQILKILHAGLMRHFHIKNPKIAVSGLNPHAGEGGHLGHEEIDVIKPLIKELQDQGYAISGPFPADTIFLPKTLQDSDAILVMYHDQALPLIKYLGFDSAVNVTLGLPFIRTSVDHGTALDLAGTGGADSGSMSAAIKLAIKLCSS